MHSADIIANETWTAAQSPHVVTAYLRVRNNATLTIAAGAVVKFDSLAGLQVGDTTLGEAGGLVLDGTSAPITLTANSGAPVRGFWRGLKLAKSLSVPAWRKVLLEWGSACITVSDQNNNAFEWDSLHLRQCRFGVQLGPYNANVHLHRSVVDSGAFDAIAVNSGLLEVDSTTIRGWGGKGLFVGITARLGPSSANSFLGNASPMLLNAVGLPGLLVQDTIDGNVSNEIFLTGGRSDSNAAVMTLFHQPHPPGPTSGVWVGKSWCSTRTWSFASIAGPASSSATAPALAAGRSAHSGRTARTPRGSRRRSRRPPPVTGWASRSVGSPRTSR